MKSTAEIWNNEITFLDTTVFKGEHLTEKSHYKPTKTFQYVHFT